MSSAIFACSVRSKHVYMHIFIGEKKKTTQTRTNIPIVFSTVFAFEFNETDVKDFLMLFG